MQVTNGAAVSVNVVSYNLTEHLNLLLNPVEVEDASACVKKSKKSHHKKHKHKERKGSRHDSKYVFDSVIASVSPWLIGTGQLEFFH